ncbi:vitamin-D-receptor interacting mediator subunit 4-domain-containing protein [Glomus cerebriforme]|uniref:Mediator of RNA polymerase II transcription subunit 4 n=1 Tax=Glomus cerebriforme TaxID=658196 RepID=A0A397TVU4_9GLOM|nr:vitamin-D-receptor interacting mediator subunit 4-domain-containing protein [Glomus cerebriforme]
MSSFLQSEEFPNEITTPVKGCLIEYEGLIDHFFTAIAGYSEGKKQINQTPIEIMKEIIALDKKLQKGLDLIEEHQKVHRKLLQMENEIDAENQALMDFALALKTGKEQLDVCLDEALIIKRAIRMTEESQVSAKDILEYANKLSQYTSAPPHFNPAIPSSMIAYPPYPDESHMRMGLLFRQYADESFEDEEHSRGEEDEEEDDDEELDHVVNLDETHARSNSFGSVEIVQQTNQTEAFNLDLNPELE